RASLIGRLSTRSRARMEIVPRFVLGHPKSDMHCARTRVRCRKSRKGTRIVSRINFFASTRSVGSACGHRANHRAPLDQAFGAAVAVMASGDTGANRSHRGAPSDKAPRWRKTLGAIGPVLS